MLILIIATALCFLWALVDLAKRDIKIAVEPCKGHSWTRNEQEKLICSKCLKTFEDILNEQ